MAELADALDLGSSGTSRAGSSPVIRITDASPAFRFLCAYGGSFKKKYLLGRKKDDVF